MSVKYFHEIRQPDGSILSCDNIRINFSVSPNYRSEFESIFNAIVRIDIKNYPVNLSDFKFKYLWQICYLDDDTKETFNLTCGYIFNGCNGAKDVQKGYLDFNPNKVGSFSQFWADFHAIKSCCEDWDIVRCDIALDIQAKRENIFVVKDSRKYAIDAYSFENRTDYLGRRSNIGFVKVYNKTLESNLTYDLVRIEVTCSPSVDSFNASFPCVYDLTKSAQFGFDIMDLTDTDLAILRMELELIRNGLDNGLMIFNSLGRNKKQKLKPFLLPESCLVVVNPSQLVTLMSGVLCLYA